MIKLIFSVCLLGFKTCIRLVVFIITWFYVTSSNKARMLENVEYFITRLMNRNFSTDRYFMISKQVII